VLYNTIFVILLSLTKPILTLALRLGNFFLRHSVYDVLRIIGNAQVHPVIRTQGLKQMVHIVTTTLSMLNTILKK